MAVEFYADVDDDGTPDKIVKGNILRPPTDQWYQMTPDLWKGYGGAFYVWNEDKNGFDFFVGMDPWAEVVASTMGEAYVTRVDIGYGHIGGMAGKEPLGYADDFTLNGKTYTFEPIPEPLTMLGMFLGLGSVGAYIRRRRMR